MLLLACCDWCVQMACDINSLDNLSFSGNFMQFLVFSCFLNLTTLRSLPLGYNMYMASVATAAPKECPVIKIVPVGVPVMDPCGIKVIAETVVRESCRCGIYPPGN